MLMISADTYLNIILNMNQTHVLFTCISAGKTSPAAFGVFTHQTSASLPHHCFPFLSFLQSSPVCSYLWFYHKSNPFSLHISLALLFLNLSLCVPQDKGQSYYHYLVIVILKSDHSIIFITFGAHAPRLKIKLMQGCKITEQKRHGLGRHSCS